MSFEMIGDSEPPAEADTSLSWREPFEWQEPAYWQEKVGNLGGLAADMLEDPRIHAAKMLLKNRQLAVELYPWHDGLHTPPAIPHYRHTYLWDSGFVQMMLAESAKLAHKSADFLESSLQLPPAEDQAEILAVTRELRILSEQFQRAGVEEGFSVVNGQQENGFISNLQYGEGTLWYEIEKHLSLDRIKKSSNYTQPPVLPLATLATYKSMVEVGDPDAQLYLEEVYRYQDKFIRYLFEHRSNSQTDRKIGVIDPHETGLDSLEQWDYIKHHRTPRSGPDTPLEIDERNRFADGAHFVFRLVKRRVVGRGDIARERELFWCNDVLMNSIYFHNLQVMSRLASELGKAEDAAFYQNLADEVERAMLADMWQDDPEKVSMPGFYSLDSEGEPISTITISNLMALTLPHLPQEKLEAILNMMDEHFDVPYPLPSGSTKSPNYDPHNQERDRLWRGPTWMNTNYYLTEYGLFMHAGRKDISPELRFRCKTWANRLTRQSNELLDINDSKKQKARSLGAKVIYLFTKEEVENSPAREHYHPHTGEGQRIRVKNFAWSWLARYMTLEEDLKTDLGPEIDLKAA